MTPGARGELSSRLPNEATPGRRTMLEDVVRGLSGSPKTISSKYFYDEAGSRLFDEITELDEYYLTRTETGIMEHHVREIVEAIGPRVLLVEFGSGSSVKTRLLLDAMPDLAAYVPVDVSGSYLHSVAGRLRAEHPEVPIHPLVADFTEPLTLPADLPDSACTVVYFPGSTIGNFPILQAARLLRRMRSLAGPTGAVLIGFDLVKKRSRLLAAYNDEAGVTARFNLNVLTRINRELGADFDLDAFEHDAPFDQNASRIEMHLVSRRRQSVTIGGRSFAFEPGERVVTEFSHKYTLDSFAELAASAGLEATDTWMDEERLFCVQLLAPTDGARR